jgi:hypothetical protein
VQAPVMSLPAAGCYERLCSFGESLRAPRIGQPVKRIELHLRKAYDKGVPRIELTAEAVH